MGGIFSTKVSSELKTFCGDDSSLFGLVLLAADHLFSSRINFSWVNFFLFIRHDFGIFSTYTISS
jgi:hypothetical protein